MSKLPKNSRQKAPSFQFYPNDWLTDLGLTFSSYETKGVWIDLLCLMHNSEPYGFLSIKGKLLDEKMIKKFINLSKSRFKIVWEELTELGMLKQDENGAFYNKRLVEDYELRAKRSVAGSQGGNPLLTGNKVKQVDKQQDKQKSALLTGVDKDVDKHNHDETPPPSVSSSVSPSTSTSPSHIKEADKEENNNGLYPNENFRASDDNKINEAAEIVCTLYFITEIQNFQSYAKVYSSLEIINTEYGMDSFMKQVEAYREYKMLSGQEKHRFQRFLGDPHNSCSDGAWCSENWIKVLEEYKAKKGITDEKENQPTMKEMKKANNE